MEVTLKVRTDKRIVALGCGNEYFSWVPCEYESGSASPAEFFESPYQDRYVIYVFLFFRILLVRLLT